MVARTSRQQAYLRIQQEAEQRLEEHPHFRGRQGFVRCSCHNGDLHLSGVVPSYYLKQLAQEAMRELEGVESIVNKIAVASPCGEIGCDDDEAPSRKPR